MLSRTGTISTRSVPGFCGPRVCGARCCAGTDTPSPVMAAAAAAATVIGCIRRLSTTPLLIRWLPLRVSLSLDLSRELRIHGGGAAQSHLERKVVLLPELLEKWIRAGQMVRHDALRAIDFFHRRTGIRRNLLIRSEAVFAGA